MDYDYGSNQMIRNQLQLSDDIQLVSQRLEVLESQVETLVSGQQLLIETLNKMAKKDSRNKPPPVRRKSQKKGKQPSASDVSKLLHLPEALQKSVQIFTENVTLNTTDIPDDLISADILSEDECTTLLNKPSKKDQMRLLLRKIKARGPRVIKKFLNIIGKDHPFIPEEVYKTCEIIVKEYKFKPVCVICVMQSTVDLKDIGDYLWAQKIISDDIFGDIYESGGIYRNKAFIWSKIINFLNGYENTMEAKEILINALKTKYEHIVEYLNENSERQIISCSCCSKRQRRQRPLASDFGSQTDISNTAIPFIIYDDNSSEDSHWDVNSDEPPGSNLQSFDLLEHFENIQEQGLQITGKEYDGKAKGDTHEKSTERQFSEGFKPETKTEIASLSNFKQEESSRNDLDDEERQELKHSLSVISTTSTICAAQPLDTNTDDSSEESWKSCEKEAGKEADISLINDGNESKPEINTDTEIKTDFEHEFETASNIGSAVFQGRFIPVSHEKDSEDEQTGMTETEDGRYIEKAAESKRFSEREAQNENSNDEINRGTDINNESMGNTERDATDERHTEGDATDERHTERDATDERHTERDATDERHTEGDATDETHTERDATDERHTEGDATDERHTERDTTDERHTERDATDERCTERESADEG